MMDKDQMLSDINIPLKAFKMNKNNNAKTYTPIPPTNPTTTTSKLVTMMIMMMLMLVIKMTIIIVFLMRDAIVVNCLSFLSLRIMLVVAQVHGLPTQKFI
jgi:hypothetical protein